MTHRLDLIKLRNIAQHLNGDATFSLDVAVRSENASASLPCTATLAPCRAKARAMAAPIPRELPVTKTTFALSPDIITRCS